MSQLNHSKSLYENKFSQVYREVAKLQLPKELRQRVLLYYNYVWFNHGTFDVNDKALSDLSPSLANEINVFTHRHMVQSVPFFSQRIVLVGEPKADEAAKAEERRARGLPPKLTLQTTSMSYEEVLLSARGSKAAPE